jgi:hypothetical protein
MENRKSRQAKLKQGPGVFKYVGGAFDTEAIPTVLKTAKLEAKLDASGNPEYDRAGRAVMVPAGAPVRDNEGNIMMGGPPKMKRTELETYVVRRVPFKLDVAVEVADEQLALKLRGMKGIFVEVDASALKAPAKEPTKADLLEEAKALGIAGAAALSKADLAEAIEKAKTEAA